MDSIVLELQRKATDKDADVAELVRMALIVATKLGLDDFREWAMRELDGYKGNPTLPQYRSIDAVVKALDPYSGWLPVQFDNPEFGEIVRTASCRNGVGELQWMLDNRPDSQIHVPFNDRERGILGGVFKESQASRMISASQLAGVLDAVRNIILDWALQLEKNGILGDGMRFSGDEKRRASQVTSVHINHFSGIMGNVSGGTIQIGDYASIHRQLKERGIPQQERNELENLLDELKTASGEKKRSLAKRGLEWVAKHAETLGKIASVIRPWFTST